MNVAELDPNLSESKSHSASRDRTKLLFNMRNCTPELIQLFRGWIHSKSKVIHPVFPMFCWVLNINVDLRHAAAWHMCVFWYGGGSAARLSRPAVRVYTRPQGGETTPTSEHSSINTVRASAEDWGLQDLHTGLHWWRFYWIGIVWICVSLVWNSHLLYWAVIVLGTECPR